VSTDVRNDGITHRIAQALIVSGYTSLDDQAKALGVCRSTAWTIVKSKHKVGGLSEKVRQKMLRNPKLPPLVRKELEPPVPSHCHLRDRHAVAVRIVG
jgi:hypothetical protein